jgi:hypothetical protein
LSPLEFPAVTVPPDRNTGFSLESCCRSVESFGVEEDGIGSALRHGDGNDLPLEVAASNRLHRPRLALQRELVLLLAGDLAVLDSSLAAHLMDVLRGLPHRLEREQRFHCGVGKSPAQRTVVTGDVARGSERLGILRQDVGRACHALHAARDIHVAFPSAYGPCRLVDRRQAAGAQTVDGHAGNGVRKPSQQQRHPRHVPVVLAGLVRAAHDHFFDLVGADARAAHGFADHEGGQVVGAHLGERPSDLADRGAHRAHDHHFVHGSTPLRIRRDRSKGTGRRSRA